MYYQIHGVLAHLSEKPAKDTSPTAVTLTLQEWEEQKTTLSFPAHAGFEHNGIHSCKAETYSKYIFGSLSVPDRKSLLAPSQKLAYYINASYLVFVDEASLPDRIIGQMIHKYHGQEMTPEFFLYGFFSEFLDDDIELLEQYENRLFELEESALRGNISDLLPRLLRSRRELTRLRNYYEQMEDMAREIGGNVKNYFHPDDLQHISLFGDKAQRLQNMAQQAIEYCQTLRDFEQAQSDHNQNRTMQFLTILTSVFFPLTVITGWYGMNFTHMPELASRFGYPAVFLISLAVITAELLLLKKKGML